MAKNDAKLERVSVWLALLTVDNRMLSQKNQSFCNILPPISSILPQFYCSDNTLPGYLIFYDRSAPSILSAFISTPLKSVPLLPGRSHITSHRLPCSSLTSLSPRLQHRSHRGGFSAHESHPPRQCYRPRHYAQPLVGLPGFPLALTPAVIDSLTLGASLCRW